MPLLAAECTCSAALAPFCVIGLAWSCVSPAGSLSACRIMMMRKPDRSLLIAGQVSVTHFSNGEVHSSMHFGCSWRRITEWYGHARHLHLMAERCLQHLP